MALTEYQANEKLAEILRTGGKGSRNVVAVIRAAFAEAPDPILVKLLVDLRALVPLLNEWNTDAVQNLLTLDWSSKSEDVIGQHSQLLVSVAAAHACHLSSILRFFVKQFIPNTPNPETESLEEYDARTQEIRTRSWKEAHKCIALMLEIVPTSRRNLMKILRDSFPFMKRHLVYLRDYTRNLLTVISYAPELRVHILRVIVDELIKLDTICSQEALEEATSESNPPIDSEVFHMESEIRDDERKQYLKEILDVRSKLDACMSYIFNYLLSMKNAEQENRMPLYTDLLTVFESSVLPVYSSHHVQFLWFVYCSFEKELWQHFLSWLWQQVQTPSIVPAIRQNAASYLAGYLARASYLDIYVVTSYIQAWMEWIHAYMASREGAGGKDNVAVHSTYYSLCQAVFYVIVFRLKDILAMRKGHEFLKSLNLDRVVTCRLNPLKYCAERVVVNFANVSRNYQFAFCYTVMERNRRSAFFEQRRTGIAPNQLLESFYPFDPFLLPKSVEFVSPLYREYDENSIDTEGENVRISRKTRDDDVDDFLDPDTMEFSPTFADSNQDITPISTRELMFSYSISPGFKHG